MSGQGQAIEVPMFEAMVSFLAIERLGGRSFAPPLGSSGYSRALSPHRRPYRTADGFLAAMPYTGAHWRAFFRAAGRDDWAAEAALDEAAARAAMIDTLYERLADCLTRRRTAEWLTILDEADVPCSPVNSIEGLLDAPHLKATGFFETASHPSEGPLVGTRPPVRFSKTPCSIDKPAPGRSLPKP